jgi:hypothetical protein
MKYALSVLLLFFSIGSTAWADAFQFVNRGNGSLAIEAAVYLKNQLVGYTNGQGILFINAPQGSNTFTVLFMGKKYPVQLNISGITKIQVVYLQ